MLCSSDSVMCVYIYIFFFIFFSMMVYQKILEFPMLYSSTLFINSLYNNLHLLISNLQSLPHLPLCIVIFSILHVLYKYFYLPGIYINNIYNQVTFIYLKFLLEYSHFTMLCYFLLYSKVNQLYTHIYPPFWGFPSHLGRHRALSRAPCAIV